MMAVLFLLFFNKEESFSFFISHKNHIFMVTVNGSKIRKYQRISRLRPFSLDRGNLSQGTQLRKQWVKTKNQGVIGS